MSLSVDSEETERKAHFALFCLHVATVLLLLAASFAGYDLFGGLVLRLPVFLILVFVAALSSDRLCPAWLAFIGGMLVDFFHEGPLGLHAIGFVVVLLTIKRRGPMLLATSFGKVWVYFMVCVFGVLALQWLALSVLNGVLFNPVSIVTACALMALLFPVLFKPLYALGQKLEGDAAERLHH